MDVILTADVARRAVARFHGPAGAWAIGGSQAGDRDIAFRLGRDVDALSHVLILLSGGVLDLEAAGGALPRLELPPSGENGQHWFACVRHIVI